MAMGRQKAGQGDLMVSWSEMPRSPGHVFYDRLQSVLIEGGFDAFAEASCRPYYAARMGAPSVPPGRYFRMHLVGYFEGIDSERGLEWRCSDSLSLRAFLRLGSRDRVPDHSRLSRSRTRLPHEVHAAVFDWVLVLIAEAGLIKGERIGVDASTMEANAALRNIVRRDNGEGYREMLERLARESGVETRTAEDLARLDRKRKDKKLSNTDWVSKSDPEAKIAKMKDGTTHLAYKPEHAVDLDTGAVVAAELHPADEGDTTTLSKTLAKAEANLEAVDAAPTSEDPAECVADKGYHSRAVLRALNDSPWKTRIAGNCSAARGIGVFGEGYPLVGTCTHSIGRIRFYRLTLPLSEGTEPDVLFAGFVWYACRSARGPVWPRRGSSRRPGDRVSTKVSARGWCRSARSSPRAGAFARWRGCASRG